MLQPERRSLLQIRQRVLGPAGGEQARAEHPEQRGGARVVPTRRLQHPDRLDRSAEQQPAQGEVHGRKLGQEVAQQRLGLFGVAARRCAPSALQPGTGRPCRS
ncbi:MAG: hypothetical protein HY744_19120 [Deltaproteobacteria bacterium]|nr:hypothetical protein [Deltaproteobacteria bacterium]